MTRNPFRIFAVGFVCALTLTALAAAESDLGGLLRNSPFGSAPDKTADKGSTPLEFRGVMMEGDTYYFSIHTTSDSRSVWLQLNQKSARDFTPTSYDAVNRQLTVDYQGSSLVLSLNSARRTPGPAVGPVPAVQPGTNAPAPTPTAATSSADEAERLSKIADEIRRRRALRQQAINSKNQ